MESYTTRERGTASSYNVVGVTMSYYYSYGKNQHIIVESKDRGIETYVYCFVEKYEYFFILGL